MSTSRQPPEQPGGEERVVYVERAGNGTGGPATVRKPARAARRIGAFLAVLALAGCGSGSPSTAHTSPAAKKTTDREEVARTVHDYFNGLGTRDAGKACEQLSTPGRATLYVAANTAPGTGVNGCQAAVAKIEGILGTDSLDPLKDTKIRVLTLHGHTATARRDDGKDVLTLRKFGSRWLIDNTGKG